MRRTLLLSGLGDPFGHGGGIGAAVEGAAVLREPLTSVLEPVTRALERCIALGVCVSLDDELRRLAGALRCEEVFEPRVERLDQGVLADVDVGGMVVGRQAGAATPAW